jgi:predicted dehydrogenase
VAVADARAVAEAAARAGVHFLRSVAEGTAHGATLDDAVRSAAALDAMLSSAERRAWVNLA